MLWVSDFKEIKNLIKNISIPILFLWKGYGIVCNVYNIDCIVISVMIIIPEELILLFDELIWHNFKKLSIQLQNN